MISNRRATQCRCLWCLCARACRFAHIGRHLPSQSISHKHMAISQECSQRLRISLRYACKYLTCRKFEKNTGMFSILLSLKRWFIRFKPNFSYFISFIDVQDRSWRRKLQRLVFSSFSSDLKHKYLMNLEFWYFSLLIIVFDIDEVQIVSINSTK